jgi:hypothetical protein
MKTLKDLHRTTVDKMADTLKDWASEPSEAARATVEEFLDQSLYSKNAKDAWRAFYQSHKGNYSGPPFPREKKLIN